MNPATDEPADPTLAAALTYAGHGWRVLPIRPGEKRPPMRAWQDAATTDPAAITNWWTGMYRGHGVGIATGPASGIFVLDVDVTDAKGGEDTLADLELTYGPLPDTVEAVTGSGGRHLIFAWPAGRTVGTNAGRLGPGLDIRGAGGQIVAAPTIHPNGTPYIWRIDHAPGEIAVAQAPGWLLALLEQPEVLQPAPAAPTAASGPDDGPAARYNASTTWDALLANDGWTLATTTRDGEQRWTRPGKEAREGASATVGHAGRDVLKVFTSSVPGLVADQAYSRFGYTAATRYRGDRSAFARDLHAAQAGETEEWWARALPAIGELVRTEAGVTVEITEAQADLAFAHLVDWPTFWAKDRTEQEWLVHPMVPRGRAVALYAPAKAGKSAVLLAALTASVTGAGAFGGGEAPEQPVEVLYLDFEMTEDDLEERLTELGYGPDVDLSHFHYALLPSLPPLDTPEGAEAVLTLVAHLGVELVIVDTFGRAVEGAENDADTVRGFYRHTGLALKALGVACLRTDHTGKDEGRGQRGSSAKVDDVDVVWRLSRTDGGARLTRTHSRVSWVPEQIDLERIEDYATGMVVWKMAEVAGVPAGTAKVIAALDRLGVPIDATNKAAREALKEAGETARGEVLAAALRQRRKDASADGNAHGNALLETPGNGPMETPGNETQNPRSDTGKREWKRMETGSSGTSVPQPPSRSGGLGTPRSLPNTADQPIDPDALY